MPLWVAKCTFKKHKYVIQTIIKKSKLKIVNTLLCELNIKKCTSQKGLNLENYIRAIMKHTLIYCVYLQ